MEGTATDAATEVRNFRRFISSPLKARVDRLMKFRTAFHPYSSGRWIHARVPSAAEAKSRAAFNPEIATEQRWCPHRNSVPCLNMPSPTLSGFLRLSIANTGHDFERGFPCSLVPFRHQDAPAGRLQLKVGSIQLVGILDDPQSGDLRKRIIGESEPAAVY
jgi:hypothetical protein